MAQKFKNVSLGKKVDVLKQLLLIAQTTESFASDGKMLKALAGALKRLEKKLWKTKFPFDDEDAVNAIDFTTGLAGIVRRFRRANRVDKYRTASASIKGYLTNLGKAIEETEENMRVLEEAALAEAEQAKKGSPAVG